MAAGQATHRGGPRALTGRPSVYRAGMAVETGRVDPEGTTPSEQAIEQDFTIPEDADYSPGAEDAAGSE